MKKPTRSLSVCVFAVVALFAGSLQAVPPLLIQYDVNRSLSGGSLTGTLEIPIGNYTIQNQGASPFTAVDLTLTVNGSSYAVNNVLTELILGTGQFSIFASSTALVFDASGTASDPADLCFADGLESQSGNRYLIGSNGNPAFEVAYTNAGTASGDAPNYPLTFAIIPEPATVTLLGLGSLMLVIRRSRFS